MNKLEQYISVKQQYDAIVENDFEEILKCVGSQLKVQYPKLNGVAFVGYTPGWNDGDECEHSGYVLVSEINDYDTVLSMFDDEEELNSEISSFDEKNIIETLEEFESLVRAKYNTDYAVAIDLRGNVEVSYSYYDCGY